MKHTCNYYKPLSVIVDGSPGGGKQISYRPRSKSQGKSGPRITFCDPDRKFFVSLKNEKGTRNAIGSNLALGEVVKVMIELSRVLLTGSIRV